MNREITEYDDKGNLIYYKDSDGTECWYKYDKKGNYVYFKDSIGNEAWREYDENNRKIHYKNSDGGEYWCKFDENNRIDITEQEFNEIEFRKEEKEYLSRTKCSRFELMEI